MLPPSQYQMLYPSRFYQKGVCMVRDEPGDKRPLLVVARGQRSLLEAVRELFAELGGVDVIEDQGPSLLSREDRNDNPSEQVAVQRLFPAPPAGAPTGELARH